ncbi:MAG: glycosyltransferase family 2 protein [Alphaproteobacteria bacterium]
MTETPLISVVMSSYNHSKYVQEAIYSVLNQTYKNFEFIINDDGSSDDTLQKIKEIQDDRIKLFWFEENQGACASVNRCIKHASGDYIALINSDDTWVTNKLEKQIKFLEENSNIAAVFSYANFKDANMNDFPLEERPYFHNIFSQANRTRAEWVRKFFFEGNCLCHPSILIRKKCYDELGLYENNFRQLPDYDMWVKFLKKYEFHIQEEGLINFRFIGSGNASSPTLTNHIRVRNELHLITKNFFKNMPMQLFKEAFKDILINKDFTSEEEYECEQAFLFINHQPIHKLIGYEKLFDLMQKEQCKNLLKDNYKFTDKDFMKLSGEVSFFMNQETSTIAMIKIILQKISATPKKKIILCCFNYLKNRIKKFL